MPRRAGRPCRYPGCIEVVRGGGNGGYCPAHARQVQRLQDAQRGTSASRGYGALWRRLRGMILAGHPLCADPYGVHGDSPALATDVDHIVPLSRGGGNTMENLQALCHSCHSRKTAIEDGRWGGGRP